MVIVMAVVVIVIVIVVVVVVVVVVVYLDHFKARTGTKTQCSIINHLKMICMKIIINTR